MPSQPAASNRPTNIQIELPKPHPAQWEIIQDPHRFKVVDCGRQFGKTTAAKPELIPLALKGFPCAFMAPNYKYLEPSWRAFKELLRKVTVDKSEQEHRLSLMGGGMIEFWSLDNPDAPLGRTYKHVVIDEAALMPLVPWFDQVIAPMLIVLQGNATLYSTPRGMNGFWDLYQRGLDPLRYPDWKSFRYPSNRNPFFPQEEFDKAQQNTPTRIFQQEYMAEFIGDYGALFRNILECATGELKDGPQWGHFYVVGVDLAKVNDFTVFTVMDVTDKDMKSVVKIERFQSVDYKVAVQRLDSLIDKWSPSRIVVEANAMGAPVIEQSRYRDRIYPFQTQTKSKGLLIDDLAVAFDNMKIRIPKDEYLVGELQAYEVSQLPSGTYRYSAPIGRNDDMVMSLALAYYAATRAETVEAGFIRF